MNTETGAEKCKWLTGPSSTCKCSPAEPRADHALTAHPPRPRCDSSVQLMFSALHWGKHGTLRAWTFCSASRVGMLQRGRKKGKVTWISQLKSLNSDTGTQSQALFSALIPKNLLLWNGGVEQNWRGCCHLVGLPEHEDPPSWQLQVPQGCWGTTRIVSDVTASHGGQTLPAVPSAFSFRLTGPLSSHATGKRAYQPEISLCCPGTCG